MKRWEKTCNEFKLVRKAIDEEDFVSILTQLVAICDKYANEEWEFAEDYTRLSEDISDIDIDNADSDDVDYALHEFYDLCDSARVWLDI